MKDTAYFVSPIAGPGPGVLLLHSWWGLTPAVRRMADRLSDMGFTVLAPDLLAGLVPTDEDSASIALHAADPDRLAALTLSSARLIAEKSADPARPIGLVGMSMGASLGLWASVRLPEVIGAVVAFYGTQSIDFEGTRATYQLHMVSEDPIVDADEIAFMEATLGLAGASVERHDYPGAGHWFIEEGSRGFDSEASELAWDRMTTFLRSNLRSVD